MSTEEMDALLGKLTRERVEYKRELAAVDATFSRMEKGLRGIADLAEYFGKSCGIRNTSHYLPEGGTVLTMELPDNAQRFADAILDKQAFLDLVNRRVELSRMIAERDRQIAGMTS